MPETIDQQVINFVAAWCDLPVNSVTLKTKFEDIGVNGEDRIQLIMELEDSFGLTFADDDMNGMNTVGDAANLIKRKLASDS